MLLPPALHGIARSARLSKRRCIGRTPSLNSVFSAPLVVVPVGHWLRPLTQLCSLLPAAAITGSPHRPLLMPRRRLSLAGLPSDAASASVVKGVSWADGGVGAERELPTIHPSSVVHESAKLGRDVVVGPYCVVGENVELEDGVRLHSHVVVSGHTSIGEGAARLIPAFNTFSATPTPPPPEKSIMLRRWTSFLNSQHTQCFTEELLPTNKPDLHIL